jgi:spheroidene monooxygenase
LVRQCTFSLWRETAAMLQYAQQGAHQVAIAAAYKHQFFSESLFVRMQVLHMNGVWNGQAFHLQSPSALGIADSLDKTPAVKAPSLELSHV